MVATQLFFSFVLPLRSSFLQLKPRGRKIGRVGPPCWFYVLLYTKGGCKCSCVGTLERTGSLEDSLEVTIATLLNVPSAVYSWLD